MDSLADLLKNRTPEEPPEVIAVKRYIQEQFGEPSSVRLQGKSLIITVAQGGLAATLRMRLPQLKRMVGPDLRIVLRIG